MNLTTEQFNEVLRRPAYAKRNPVGGESASAVVERAPVHDPLAAPQAQVPHPGKYVVRITSYRTRLLDEDNLAEKYHCDSCRYAGLIPADSPDQTSIQVAQIKVRTKEECCTIIEIEMI